MKNQLTSNRLNVNAGIMSWYVKELKKLTKRMTKECLERLTEVYKQGYTQISLDESISSQARIALNELNRKYGDKFSTEAKELVQKLLTKTNKYSTWQFTKSLKDMLGDKAKDFSLSCSAGNEFMEKNTPAGAVKNAQHIIDEFNKTVKDPKKQIKLTDENINKIKELTENIHKTPEGREKDVATALLLKYEKELVPPSMSNKLKTLRNMSLLLNPKTFNRNLTGNAIFGGVENLLAKPLAAGIDKLISPITKQRTRVLPKGGTYLKGLWQGLKEGNEDVLKGINTRDKIGQRFDIQRKSFDYVPFKDTVKAPENLLTNKKTGITVEKNYTDFVQNNINKTVKDFVINKTKIPDSNGQLSLLDNDNTKQIIINSIFGKSRTPVELTNLYDKKTVNLSVSSIKKMISTAYKEVKKQIENIELKPNEREKILNDSLNILSNVKNIYKKAVPILQHGDLNGVKGRTITRYALPVSKDGNRYNVMLTVKNDKVDDIGILYDLKSKNIPLKVSSTPSNDDLLHLQGNNTCITDLIDFVNSNLEKYKPQHTIQDKKVLNFKALPGRLLNNAAAIGETALNWSLQVPDRMFYQAAFNESLANQMAAAGHEPAEKKAYMAI